MRPIVRTACLHLRAAGACRPAVCLRGSGAAGDGIAAQPFARQRLAGPVLRAAPRLAVAPYRVSDAIPPPARQPSATRAGRNDSLGGMMNVSASSAIFRDVGRARKEAAMSETSKMPGLGPAVAVEATAVPPR